MRRFLNDDEGYTSWLQVHPHGYVLNTYPHVTSEYLILHRARCRTINRPLASGREWTRQYGKSCDDDRAVLEEWALTQTGSATRPCAQCLPGDPARRVTAVANAAPGTGGGRRPHAAERVAFLGEPIAIVVDPPNANSPRLVIEGAQWLAETFFTRDPSAIGPNSYDSWIATTRGSPRLLDRITDEDVTAVNRTMAARSGHAAWGSVIAAGDVPWLEAIDPTWDLVEMADSMWSGTVAPALQRAFGEIRRRHLGIAVVTKVLHIKRPRLIPVLDSLVLAQVGARATDDVASWVHGTARVREVAIANVDALIAIRDHLAAKGVHGRSLVRILDSLLWTSSSSAGLFASLDGWERVLRPRAETA